ncbi:MAG: purine-binding chemotaxis protein CheW [Spirochaetes bacterium]|nr:purine-binding chemotaxis protein CheW [Spirochaetota bacterium]
MRDKTKNEKSYSSIQIVCFSIGDEEYGIEILKVQEILRLPQITILPKAADFILGVIDLRGKILPIIDMSKRFGIESKTDMTDPRAIVVNIKGKEVGLAIDSVSHVVKVDSGDIEPPPAIVKGISGRYIVGIAKVNEDFVVILDIDRIFSPNELMALEQIKR